MQCVQLASSFTREKNNRSVDSSNEDSFVVCWKFCARRTFDKREERVKRARYSGVCCFLFNKKVLPLQADLEILVR